MKHKLLLAVIQLVAFSSVYAQNVNGLLFDATNTATRDASAAFEINANTNTPGSPLYGGLLLPRVALTGTTDATTISGTEATSLLVYNTATVSDVTPGFYYWNGSSWLRIISGNGSFPTGSGTTNYLARWASANTLGIGVSYDDGTNVGIGITSPQKKLDVLSTVNDFVTVGANTFGVGQWTGIHFGYRENNSSYRKSAIVFERTDNSGGGGNAAGKIHLLNGPASGAGSATLADSRLTVGENGNVGIGETAPVFRLHVKGGNANTEQMTLGATTTGNFALTSQDGGAYGLYAGVGNTGNAWLQVGRHNTATAYNLIMQASGGNVGIGNVGPIYKLDVTGDTRTTGDFYGDVHVDDTRNVNDPPTTYNNEVAFDFKARATIGVGGSGTYSGNMTIAPWGDNSGDASHQINFNEGGLFWRQGQPDAATWDAWSQIVTTAPGGTGTTDYVTKWTSATNLGTTTDGGIFGTSGNTGTTRTLTILDNGDARINFGSYPGTYTSALQIQNNDNTRFVWLSPLDNASGANARLRSSGSGLDIYTGGGNDAGTYSTTFATSGYVGIGTTAPTSLLNVYGAHGTTQTRLTLPAVNNGGGTGEVNLQLWVSEPGVTWDAGGIGTNVTNNNGAPAGFGRINAGLGQSYIRFITNGGAMTFNTTNNAGTYYQTMYMTNGNVGINTTNPQGTLHVNGNFANQEITGLNASASQLVASNAGATEISMGAYPAVNKIDDNTVNGSVILVVASVTVSGNDIRFANGIGGLGFPGTNSVQNLAHGVASYTVTLERRINGGGWTSLYSQTAMCAFAVGDYYMQANGLTNAFGISGDMYRFPNSVSLSYLDNVASTGNYEYRLLFTPGGYNKLNGYNYSITQRNLTALQIKR